MSIIRVVYEKNPDFPATDQHPEAVRYQVGQRFVDAINGAPTQEEVDAFLAPPVPTLTAAVQAHLDTTAQEHGYDSIYTACTYADEPAVAQFQLEGQALRAWRSLVWAHCHGVMAAVQAQQRAVPTEAELIAELPALVMP
jgi:hypothetical protein